MFGLLNANARLYSPYLGRFVSPDPLLNCEGGAWDYNPYVYARNNPYKYIDRNGEFWWLAIPVWMGFANAFANFDNINNAGDFFRCFGADFSSWKGVLYTCGTIAGTTALCIAMPYAIPFVASALGVTAESAIAYAATSALAGTISYFTDEALNSAIYGTPFKFSWNKWAFTTISWTAMGAYEGYAQAKAKGLNGWTGKSKVMKSHHQLDERYPDAMAARANADKANPATIDSPAQFSAYQKGEMGKLRRMNEIIQDGGEILGTEVTIEVNGIKIRPDIVYRNKDGLLIFSEVKNGPCARFTTNQAKTIPIMQSEHPFIVPKGGNAAKIPAFKKIMINNKPYTGDYGVEVIHYNAPF